MPDIDERTKPVEKRSKKDTSPRKKLLAKSSQSEKFYEEKSTKGKKQSATAN